MDSPEVDVGAREVPGVLDIAHQCLPSVTLVGLALAGELGVELRDGEAASPGDGNVAGVAVGADATQPGGVVRLCELQPAEVAPDDQVVGIRMFVDDDPGVVAGHDDLTKDGQGGVVAGGGDETSGSVRRPGSLHVVDAGVDEDVLQFGLHRQPQVDPVDAGVVGGADLEVAQDDKDGGEAAIERRVRARRRDDGGAGLRHALDDGPVVAQGEVADCAEDRDRLLRADDLDRDPAGGWAADGRHDDPPAEDAGGNGHAATSGRDHVREAARERRGVVGGIVADGPIGAGVEDDGGGLGCPGRSGEHDLNRGLGGVSGGECFQRG